LAAEGAKVALVDLAEDKVREVAEEVKQAYGTEARSFTADVTKEEQVQRMVEEVQKEFGQIDCLFNNAGYQGLFAPVDTYSFEDFEKVMKINVAGVFVVLKHVSKVMVQQKRGSIVNTASCAWLGLSHDDAGVRVEQGRCESPHEDLRPGSGAQQRAGELRESCLHWAGGRFHVEEAGGPPV